MMWIEQLFGVSPDGGTGSLEMMLVVAILLLVGPVTRYVKAVRRS